MGSPGPDLPLVCFCHPVLVSTFPGAGKGSEVQLAFKEKRTKSEKHLALFDNKIDMLTRMLDSVGLGLRFRLG